MSTVGTGTADLRVRLGSADATITHSIDSTTNQFTDDIDVAGRSGADSLALSLKVGSAGAVTNSQFEVYAGIDTTSAVELVADLAQPAHETTRPRTPAQGRPTTVPDSASHVTARTCRSSPPRRTTMRARPPARAATTAPAASPPTTCASDGEATSRTPPTDGAFLLGAWTMDDNGSVVATSVGTAADTSKGVRALPHPGQAHAPDGPQVGVPLPSRPVLVLTYRHLGRPGAGAQHGGSTT